MVRDGLADAARAALGGGRELAGFERLTGGTRKGVYRLTMDDATTAIAYSWARSENYWPQIEGDGDVADAFTAGVGFDLFAAAHARLAGLGLRVPTIYLADGDLAIVVHGELGLDHVLVDRDGAPVLIDIENLMYFDVEWEHVFLRIRLGADYPRLAVDGLDEARLALYLLTQRLSLTAGPLRLLDSDFPQRDFMRSIAEVNLTAALALAGPDPRRRAV